MTNYSSYMDGVCTSSHKHHPPKMTSLQVVELDDVVRAVVVKFLAEVHDSNKIFCFETCEGWVYNNVDHQLAAEMVTRTASCAHALYTWVASNGLGGWDGLREERPEMYTPNDMFQSAVASWLHDIIGAPAPQ